MTTNTKIPSDNVKRPSVAERRAALEAQFPEWPRDTVATHFSKASKIYNERTFIQMENESITYGETWENAKQYAKALLNLGVKRRDHIAILMDNDTVYPSLMIASSLLGAVFIPMNTMLSKDELEYIIGQSDTRFLFTQQATKNNRLGESIAKILDEPTFLAESKLDRVICVPTNEEPLDDRFLSWDEFCSNAETTSDRYLDQRWKESRYPNEVGAIIYTSGSTGKPKGVMLTDEMLLRSAYSTCLSRAIEDGRITFAPLPFYHCYNLIEGIFAMSFVGGSLIAPPGFSPLASLQMMEKFKANDFLCVPSILIPLLNHPRISEFDLSNLFAMWCGSAPAPLPVWKKAVELLDVEEIITGYGQSEVSSSGVTTEVGVPLDIITSRVGRPKIGGVSGLPEFNGSNIEYKTIDKDTSENLEPGKAGELAVRGATVSHGYYKKPIETAEVIDKDGWLRTGDVGRIDENGYIKLLGRSKDMYKVSGELVSPKEVEEVISTYPAVAQVSVIGVPDTITTEAGAAFIELKAGESCTRKDIVNWCSTRLARFKIPRHVWFVESSNWPMTSTGKIQKFRLKEIAEEKLSERKR